MKRRILSGFSVLLIILLSSWALFNRQLLRDTYIVRSTALLPASQTLSADIDLTKAGDFIYKASQPAVEQPSEFNQACRGV